MPCDAMRKGSRDVHRWHFGMEWVSFFWAACIHSLDMPILPINTSDMIHILHIK